MAYTKAHVIKMSRQCVAKAREAVCRWDRREAAFWLNRAARIRRIWTHDRFGIWIGGVGRR